MKKIYRIKMDRCDCEGHYNGTDEEFVATENIEAVIEAKKVEIEKIGQWWMGHRMDLKDRRPHVTAEELVIREA